MTPPTRPAPPPSPLRDLPITFIGSFPDPAVSLDPPLPELAFVGRSNVGKSSLLNALVGRRGLARVSSTPGKTTMLNVFRLPACYLIDLPGYGWARASKSERSAYRDLLRRYLRGRDTLHGVVWLLDIRHDPSADDQAIAELLAETARPVLAVLTKADKLKPRERRRRTDTLARHLGLTEDQVQSTSSRTGDGIADLGHSILAALP